MRLELLPLAPSYVQVVVATKAQDVEIDVVLVSVIYDMLVRINPSLDVDVRPIDNVSVVAMEVDI